MAGKILKNIPETIKALKSLINRGLKTDLQTGLEMEMDVHKGPISPTKEGRERIEKLMKKR